MATSTEVLEPPPPPARDSAESEPHGSLRQRAIRGSLWTLGGYGGGQAIRLVGNLLLTRLLFPDAFGLMALIQIVQQGVQLFSDVGFRGSIIHHKRGDDPRFLDTAWTLQILRGGILWVALCAASIPAAAFYGRHELVMMIPVAGLGGLIEAFSSTAKYTLARRVIPRGQILLEVGGRLGGVLFMVSLALVWQSVWVLLLGGLCASSIKAFFSHRLIAGYRNRLCFDREAARSMFRFGMWVLVGTALTFLLGQGDRLILGKVLSNSELGVYSIAFFLSQALVQVIARLSRGVLQPVYSRLSERGTGELRRQTLKLRGGLMLLTLPPVWLLAIFAQPLVDTLYDPRYSEAGWMLRILAVGAIGASVSLSADRVILAQGDSFRYMLLQVARSLLMIVGMLVGWYTAEIPGFLIGIAAARILDYVPLAFFLRRYGVWLPRLDLAALGTSALVLSVGFNYQRLIDMAGQALARLSN